MAKKFGKFLAFAAIASAAAGAYYYLKNKKTDIDESDFDDFDEDDDISLEEYLKEEASQSEQTERSIKNIFPINLSSETVSEAKESLKKAVLDIGDRVAGVADTITGVVKPGTSDVEAESFQFFDLTEDKDSSSHTEEDHIDIINMKKRDVQETDSPVNPSAEADDDDDFDDKPLPESDTQETFFGDGDSSSSTGEDPTL